MVVAIVVVLGFVVKFAVTSETLLLLPVLVVLGREENVDDLTVVVSSAVVLAVLDISGMTVISISITAHSSTSIRTENR